MLTPPVRALETEAVAVMLPRTRVVPVVCSDRDAQVIACVQRELLLGLLFALCVPKPLVNLLSFESQTVGELANLLASRLLAF